MVNSSPNRFKYFERDGSLKKIQQFEDASLYYKITHKNSLDHRLDTEFEFCELLRMLLEVDFRKRKDSEFILRSSKWLGNWGLKVKLDVP